MVKISPERVTGQEQGKSSGRIATFTLWTGRIKLHNTLTLPVLLYGSETWTINPLKPNDLSRGCTAPLTSKSCILYIYSTNIGTGYLKHGIYSPFLCLQNAVCFIIVTYFVPVLFTFYIQGVLKLKK